MRILYIGNKTLTGKTPNAHDTILKVLSTFSNVKSVSKKNSKLIRGAEVLTALMSLCRFDFLIIDTYSTKNYFFTRYGAYVARLFKKPYICILHGGELPLRFHIHKRSMSIDLHSAATIVSPSKFLAKFFINEGFNVTQIPNPIEIEQIKFTKRVSARPKILWVRSMYTHYNPSLAVQIFNEVQVCFPELELTFVGSNGNVEPNELLRNSRRINYLGLKSKEEWMKIAEGYDIFLNTSDVDNYPLSILEALSMGMVVVSTRVGDIGEIIDHKKSGFLYDKGNSNEAARLIMDILKNKYNTEEISREARKVGEMHDVQFIAKKWQTVLYRLTS